MHPVSLCNNIYIILIVLTEWSGTIDLKKTKITVIINLACNLYRIIDIYITDYTNIPVNFEGCRGRDRMVVVFTTTYAISCLSPLMV